MSIPMVYRFPILLCCALLTTLSAFSAKGQSSGSLHGRVVDPLGNAVPNAQIVLLQDDREVVHGTSDAEGAFNLTVPVAAATRHVWKRLDSPPRTFRRFS